VRIRHILTIIGIAFVILIVALTVVLYRTREIAASSYEVQAGRWWAVAAGGFDDFASQILSLKPDPASQPAVCHNAKVQLQNLNTISTSGDVPEEYAGFHAQLLKAMSTNKRYYRKILQLCAQGAEANGTILSSLSALGNQVEEEYQDAYARMPGIGTVIEEGTATEIDERLAKIFQPKPKPVEQLKPRVVEVPRRGYSPDFPPAVGSIVFVETPRRVGVNLRVAPSLNAARVEGRELVQSGERVLVLDRIGYWLFVETADGYMGYIRWWYEGTPYVRP